MNAWRRTFAAHDLAPPFCFLGDHSFPGQAGEVEVGRLECRREDIHAV